MYAAGAMAIVPLSELLGQPVASAFLRGVVARGRYSNAYLFHGPAGVGKTTAALAFARAILCERTPKGPRESAPGAAADEACGRCAACHKSAGLKHPDLRFLFPVSGEERDLDETVAETLEEVRRDPLFVFRYEKAASIRLSLTRELLRELAYQPFEAAVRVVVVRDADRMREDQYSALLKTLEEPGSATVWVLTSSRPARLPATIRSRCQRVRFAPLAEGVVREFLEVRVGATPSEARLATALAAGNLGRALLLRDEEPRAERDEALRLLEPALRGDSPGLWRVAQQFMKYGKTGRERLRRMIELHELWLRDVLRIQAGAATDALANRDRESELRSQARGLGAREIRRRLMVLEEALRSIEGNVTPDLTLFSAMARMSGSGLGAGEWPAHPTARWDY